MPTVAIVYFSARGTTKQLAEAISRGVSSQDWQPLLLPVIGSDIREGRFRNEDLLAQVDQTEAVIWGSPTYMGGPAAEFKAMADASSERWETQRWKGKTAAGFTIGGSFNGDQSFTLQYFHILSMQHGMVWIGIDIPSGYHPAGLNRLGVQTGVSAQTSTQEVGKADLETGTYLGARVVKITKALANQGDA